MTTPIWNEEKRSEAPAVALLRKLGYTEAPAELLESERATLKDTILTPRLSTALQRLNPWLSPTSLAKAIKQITHVLAVNLTEANEILYNHLTYGLSVEQDLGAGRKGQTVRFFDFDTPANNDFLVVRQYKVHGSKRHIYPDITCFVNGLPLVVIECKSPTKGDKWRQEAIKQLHRYQEADTEWKGEGAPKLFETVQIVIGACEQAACYGTTGTPSRFFFEWKESYPRSPAQLEQLLGRTPTPQDTLLASMLAPANLLDIIRNFVTFETEGGRKVKKLCRYKQFIAVNRAIERMRSGTGSERGGVVWHTQGSGKSLTMLWLALKLRRDSTLQNPALVIVTDRTALDKQISGTFVACGFPNPERAKSVKHLRGLLTHATGKTITTTVQKFQDAASRTATTKTRRQKPSEHPELTTDSNVVVMVDEAHRSQYRGLAANMRKAMPNACFFGFTGTPIDKKDKSTLETFGPYIDTYTIEQAVRDGATVPIFYEGRLPEVRVLGQNLDKLFDRVFADRSEEERAAIRKKYANEQTIAAAPQRIRTICLDILEHYQKYIEPNGFKAQIVAVSREAAALYKETLDDINAPESVLIMSAAHNDTAQLARYHLRKDEQDRQVERFKDKSEPLALLIVCDMLLTGFDAPVEQVLYLDTPLREHNLLQAIARTNRRDEGKDYGLIVDYWGVSQALQDALAVFSPDDVEGALEPKQDELPRLEQRHQAAMRLFDGVGDKHDLNACVAVLEPEDVRAEFDIAFRRFAQSLDMLYPDPKALPFADDARWLGKIRQAARARYRDGALDISDCGAKVRKLIEDAIIADGVEILVKEVSLFSKDFDDKLAALKTKKAKASEMEHAIRHEIHVKLEENPVFYQSLRERLEDIIRQRKDKRIDDAQQLSLLQALYDSANTGQSSSAGALGLSESGYAIYGLLDQSRPMVAEDREPSGYSPNRDLADLIDDAIAPHTELVDWETKDDIQREMRLKVKKQLRAAGLSGSNVEDLARQIVALAKARRPR
ncbi:Type I restriction-modification system, restriction subunit R [Enhygromyxa salina]|uniref:Type I restriction enzyme endonuclease subunit n=1 Tax=Enhygromyxa salina TaxID=215803 RepID=A0A0C2CTJ0_9BACT|nr:type I restriction endonuclease subunit R [Enhygromyxa salina]KIG12935.1 Type I restriction-modification system, restriction subunit R [Enhygromyxa salina]